MYIKPEFLVIGLSDASDSRAARSLMPLFGRAPEVLGYQAEQRMCPSEKGRTFCKAGDFVPVFKKKAPLLTKEQWQRFFNQADFSD